MTHTSRDESWTRRRFLERGAVLGAGSLLPWPRRLLAAEPPPEVRSIRLVHAPALCLAPQYLAEDLLRAEGFDKVTFVPAQAGAARYSPYWVPNMLAEGLADISMGAAPGMTVTVGNGGPLVVIGGIHAGCYELFAHHGVRAVKDLKKRSISVSAYTDGRLFVSSMLAYVGLDPKADVRWVTTQSDDEAMALFESGEVDAFLGFPPQPQQLRARRVGRLLLSTTLDRPWSQYFCCMLGAHRPFVQRHPVATRRALRALLKAADVCVNTPDLAVRHMADRGFTQDTQAARQLLRELPYARWRESDPEDTLRFYTLRLHESGLMKATPKEVIALGTDWRFLRSLKQELKA